MSNFLNTRLETVRSGEILSLIEALDAACGERSPHFLGSPLRFYLTACVYPQGAGTKRVKISTAHVLDSLLDTKVGKLELGDLRDLCNELAIANGKALELCLGEKLVTFLNRTIDVHKPAKGPTELQQRREAVVQQRRKNRRD